MSEPTNPTPDITAGERADLIEVIRERARRGQYQMANEPLYYTYAREMADAIIAAGWRPSEPYAFAEALDRLAGDTQAMERGRKVVEDELISWRDARLSTLGRRNGLVIREDDSRESSMIRFGFEMGYRIALRAEADRIRAEAGQP